MLCHFNDDFDCDLHNCVVIIFSVTGDDFEPPDDTMFQFLMSQSPSTGDTRCVAVTINEDMNYEADHVFTMTMGMLASPATVFSDTINITIIDNNGKGVSVYMCTRCGSYIHNAVFQMQWWPLPTWTSL